MEMVKMTAENQLNSSLKSARPNSDRTVKKIFSDAAILLTLTSAYLFLAG